MKRKIIFLLSIVLFALPANSWAFGKAKPIACQATGKVVSIDNRDYKHSPWSTEEFSIVDLELEIVKAKVKGPSSPDDQKYCDSYVGKDIIKLNKVVVGKDIKDHGKKITEGTLIRGDINKKKLRVPRLTNMEIVRE